MCTSYGKEGQPERASSFGTAAPIATGTCDTSAIHALLMPVVSQPQITGQHEGLGTRGSRKELSPCFKLHRMPAGLWAGL